MTSWKQWLEPSRHLPVLFLMIAVLLAGALLWLGWQLTAQDEELADQRLQERRESVAGLAVAALQSALSHAQERLADIASQSWTGTLADAQTFAASLPADSAVVLWRGNELEVYPDRRISFYPVTEERSGPPDSLFAPAERLEFREANFPKAVAALDVLARSADSNVRAAALLRIARVQRKQERWEEALDTYREMSRLGEAVAEGLPAELLAGQARLVVLEHLGRDDERREEAAALFERLRQNPWRLSRGVYEFYLAETHPTAGSLDAIKTARALASGITLLYEELSDEPQDDGRRLLCEEDRPVLALWRSTSERSVVLLLGPKWIESRWNKGLMADVARQGVGIGLSDLQGRPVLGPGTGESALQTVRLASTTGLPFNLYAVTTNAETVLASSQTRRRFIFGALAVITLLIVAGSIVVGRAVRRELVLSRMQSDFVSAVSHEFRTPLTSVCLLTEQLAAGRVKGVEDQKEYFGVLAHESQRLRRLVEGLLNFGQMESGAMQYRFETIDPAELVREVTREFQNDAAASGYRVEVRANGAVPLVAADRAALTSAIWNLLDNAVKYSPHSKTVWAELDVEDGRAAIRVRDRGLGIPAAERRTIFEKFRRGDAAREASIRGTGMGLAMVQRIVVAHGGEIRLESEIGQGSAFTVLLPTAG